MKRVVDTMRVQQRKDGPGPYHFQRNALTPTDTLVDNGIVAIRSNPSALSPPRFRPSDDACIFPFLVPSNLFAVTSLRQLAELASHRPPEPRALARGRLSRSPRRSRPPSANTPSSTSPAVPSGPMRSTASAATAHG